jgi:hypothetical protein
MMISSYRKVPMLLVRKITGVACAAMLVLSMSGTMSMVAAASIGVRAKKRVVPLKNTSSRRNN